MLHITFCIIKRAKMYPLIRFLVFFVNSIQYPEKFDISEYILVNWETAHVATSDVHYHNYISKPLMVRSGYVLQLRWTGDMLARCYSCGHIRLFVRLSQVGVLSKRINGSGSG